MVGIHLRASAQQIWNSCFDIAAFTGVGYLCGRTVNWVSKWTSKPSFFGKSDQVDLQSATICCALFVTIDRLVQALLLSAIRDKEEVNRPIYTVIRIAVALTAAVTLFNVIVSQAKLTSLEWKPMAAIVMTAIVVYSQAVLNLYVFNDRP